jgi:hypothetical protein
MIAPPQKILLQTSLTHKNAITEQSPPDFVYGRSIAAPHVRTIAP